MAVNPFILCVILCLTAPRVHPQSLYGYHVSEVGRPVTVLCPPHQLYISREWVWSGNLLRPPSVIYIQYSESPVDATRARPDMSLNLTDWSLTIGSLQVEDTGLLNCIVSTRRQRLDAITLLVVYNTWLDVRSGTSLTLQCPVAAERSTTRQWYIRHFESAVSISYLLYNQTTSGVTKGRLARDDMSLDTDSFNLTAGNVTLDDYRFTCSVTSQQTTNFWIIFTAIYSVLLEVEEGTSVTLPCDALDQARTNGNPYTRTWQRVNGDILYHRYLYNSVFFGRSPAARADMSLNIQTFSLTIGRVQPVDETMFVCTFAFPYFVRSVKLIIYKTPTFTSIHPNVGPLSGGTKLTLTGSYLSISGLIIKLADVECPTTFMNSMALLCITPAGVADVLNTPLRITITWSGGARVLDTMQTFTYRPDPTVTKLEPRETILSGGTGLTVTGDGLDVVGEPILQVTVLYTAVPVRVFQSVCQTVSSTAMKCPVPTIDILGSDGNLDLSAFTTPSPRRRRHVKASRPRRQVDDNQEARINNDKIDFQLGLLLDGVPTYRNLSESLPPHAQLTVYADPEVYRWTELKVVTRAKIKLEVKGHGLLVGIQSTDYHMLIGQSECSTLDVYGNILICTAPRDTPAPHHMDTAQGLLRVRVHIGIFKKPFLVGMLQYKLSFFDDPLTKWGIIGAAVLIGIILVMVTIICVIKKCRKVE